jgi:SAM-dependent methyltransferase
MPAGPVPCDMVDVAKLPPAELAAQLGLPAGEIGIAVGEYMNRVNSRLIKAAYALLAPPVQGRVLEIGFGNGKFVGDLVALAPGLTYSGVELSETMIEEAGADNRALVRQGRIELRLAGVDDLPYPDAAFDRALAVNTIYFWPDQLRGLTEIRRVLRDNGFLVLASMTPETSARSPTARPEHGFRILDRDALEALHRQAGFQSFACELYEEDAERLDGTIFHRSYNMVRAG